MRGGGLGMGRRGWLGLVGISGVWGGGDCGGGGREAASFEEVVDGGFGDDTDGGAFDGGADEVSFLLAVRVLEEVLDVVSGAGDGVDDGPLCVCDVGVGGEEGAVLGGLEA